MNRLIIAPGCRSPLNVYLGHFARMNTLSMEKGRMDATLVRQLSAASIALVLTSSLAFGADCLTVSTAPETSTPNDDRQFSSLNDETPCARSSGVRTTTTGRAAAPSRCLANAAGVGGSSAGFVARGGKTRSDLHRFGGGSAKESACTGPTAPTTAGSSTCGRAWATLDQDWQQLSHAQRLY